MTIPEPGQLGALIRRFRLASGLSQERLAERSGLSARAVSDLERGLRTRTRPETLRMLAEALALDEAEWEALLQAANPELRQSPVTVNVAFAPEHQLPSPASELIGREREVAAIVAHLSGDSGRLTTLTGPGGVGKTTLALETARLAAPGFVDGVVFVDLAPVTEPEQVASAIAQTLGLHESGERSIRETLGISLRNRRLLLVLDNFEQVIEAAPLVSELLGSTTALRVLTTSREALRVRGEEEFVVEPLPLPAEHELLDLERLAQSPSVGLFMARAGAVKPGFALTAENAGAITGICRRLDGLPLAIELAASRIRHFPPEILVEHFDRRLPVLTGGPRDLPARQQTLRNTIAWSYGLVSTDEQALFRRLGVFAGGASLAAIEAVIPAAGALNIDLLSGLASLVDKSLVREHLDQNSLPRFTMLETIREFANEQLEQTGELEPAREALAAWVIAFVESGRGQNSAFLLGSANLRELDEEVDNIRLSFDTMVARGNAVSAARLFVGTYDYFYIRGLLREAEAMGRKTLELANNDPLPSALHGATLSCLSGHAHQLGDIADAVSLSREALAVLQHVPDAGYQMTGALLTLDMTLRDQGHYVEAMSYAQQAYDSAFQSQHEGLCVIALYHMGRIALLQGDLDNAVDRFSEALNRGLVSGANEMSVYAAGRLAFTQVQRGEVQAASAALRTSARLRRDADSGIMGLPLDAAAMLAVKVSQYQVAAMLFAADSALRAQHGIQLLEDFRAPEVRKAVRAHLGEDVYETASRAGQQLNMKGAMALVLELIDGIEAERAGERQPD